MDSYLPSMLRLLFLIRLMIFETKGQLHDRAVIQHLPDRTADVLNNFSFIRRYSGQSCPEADAASWKQIHKRK